MRSWFSRFLSILVLAVTVAAIPRGAAAQVRPYFAKGSAVLNLGTGDVVGTGNATHLGRYTEAGKVSVTPVSVTEVLVSGCLTYTAANGDKLHAFVCGKLNPITGAIIATVKYVGGCGRFVGAVGESTLTGQLVSLVGYVAVAVVEVAGIVEY